jgi:gag-polypeptide of LTR copia-type
MEMQLKIQGFSGEKKDWERWSITFLAKSKLRGYRELLVGLEIVPTKGVKGYDKFMQKNDFAFAELLISNKNDVCLGLVDSSRSELMPEGDARLAWTNLVQKFAPTTKSNLIKTKREFVESRLEDISIDTDVWIQGLETLRRRLELLGHKISEMDLIIHIIHNLPREYETTIEFIENELEMDTASLDRVRERLRSKFERISKTFKENEKALVSFQKYKGNCTYCGIYGHKGSECRKRISQMRNQGSNQGDGQSQNDSSNNRTGGFKCHRCHKVGHFARNCPKKPSNQGREGQESANLTRTNEIALIGSEDQQIPSNLWVGNSGATSHITCCEIGLFDTKPSNQKIVVGDGRSIKVEKTGKLRVEFEGKEGEEPVEVILEGVKFVPEMKINLFSFMVAIQKGASLHSEGTSLILTKGKLNVHFNTKVPMGLSFLIAAKVKNRQERALVTSERKQMKLETFHRMLGHLSIDTTRLTARGLDLQLTGCLTHCENCILAKIRKKNIKKVSESISKTPGERLLMDISFIKQENLGKRNIWELVEEQFSKMKWSIFNRRKSDMIKEMIVLIKKLKAKDPKMSRS